MARLFASSGRKAAIRFSPVPKKKFEAMTQTTATASVPGPVKYRAAVKTTQPMVVKASSRFLAARASAQAPTSGAVSTMRAYETASVAVHASVAHGARCATTATK